MFTVSVTVPGSPRRCFVHGESYGQLAVTPALQSATTGVRYDGRSWAVTHIRTGRPLLTTTDIDQARTAAEYLAGLVDWNRPLEALRADPVLRVLDLAGLRESRQP
jgi:hypothetical protein